MYRRSRRARQEFLRATEAQRVADIKESKKNTIRSALQNNTALPSELKGEDESLINELTLNDKLNENIHDEYSMIGQSPPNTLITTSYNPSPRLKQMAKELTLLFPNSQRENRGHTPIEDIMATARRQNVTDVVVLHEHRGTPDALVISHLPYGPTLYFTLFNVLLRHDIAEKVGTAPAHVPRLVFENFTTKLGSRVERALSALFWKPKDSSTRVVSVINVNNRVHVRNHSFSVDNAIVAAACNTDTTNEKDEIANKERKKEHENKQLQYTDSVELEEIGPRFQMELYKIEKGTLDMKHASTEWVLRPFMNSQNIDLGVAQDI